METSDDMKVPVIGVNLVLTDPSVQLETEIFLSNKPETILYHALKLFDHLGCLDFLSQLEIRDYLGYSENTYYKLRKSLVDFGVIRLEKQGRQNVIKFNTVYRLNQISKRPKDPVKCLNFLKSIMEKVKFQTPEVLKQEEIKQAQIALDGKIEEKAIELNKKKEEVKRKNELKFPNEDYNIVLSAFKKYKKVGLMGPEVVRAKHAIKQMFLAQRTPKQIIDCIKFFVEHQRDEDYRWLHAWTLETVMKKMPEFLAGQLRSSRIGDDIPED